MLDASELPALLAFLVDVIREAAARLKAMPPSPSSRLPGEGEGDEGDGDDRGGGGGGGGRVGAGGKGGGGSALAKMVLRGTTRKQLEVFTYESVVGALVVFFEQRDSTVRVAVLVAPSHQEGSALEAGTAELTIPLHFFSLTTNTGTTRNPRRRSRRSAPAAETEAEGTAAAPRPTCCRAAPAATTPSHRWCGCVPRSWRRP